MKTLAIIAEYNPFHNGHLYHLNTAKELSGASHSITLMSGNFLQRGVPAMWDKYTRGHMSTVCGIDLALELPFPYATGSAKDFASGAVNILDKLNTIDYLCFGAENDDIVLLTKIADLINEETPLYKELLTEALSSGLSFPEARAKAIYNSLDNKDKELSSIINQPNNILAIEYIAALLRTSSTIKPVIIKRKESMYHDKKLHSSISSATAIRNSVVASPTNIEQLKTQLPLEVYELICSSFGVSWPVLPEMLTPFLQAQLLNPINFSEICDISEDFANKLYNINPATNYQDIAEHLTSKDLTASRVYRNLIHLILQYRESDRNLFLQNGYAMYANIISFRRESSALIKQINEQTSIPLITKKADFDKYLSNYPTLNHSAAKAMWNYDTKATTLYNALVYNSYNYKLPNDFNIQLPIV